MNALNISSFIWGIADDVLRDVYVRGKYRDVILPMTVIRRLDAMLEPTNDAVLRMKDQLEKSGITNPDSPCAKPPAKPSIILLAFGFGTSPQRAVSNSCAVISKITSMASRPTSKKFSTSSSFATRFQRS